MQLNYLMEIKLIIYKVMNNFLIGLNISIVKI